MADSLPDIQNRMNDLESMNLALSLLIASLLEQMHVDRPSLLQAMTDHFDLLESQEHAGDVTEEIARSRRDAMNRLMQAFCLEKSR